MIELNQLMKLQWDIINNMEKLNLADQCQCMGNQAVNHGLTELSEVRNDCEANKMFSSVDNVHQFSRFGKNVDLMKSSWEMN